MLATALGREVRLPGPTHIHQRLAKFQRNLPALCRELHVNPAELQFLELRALIDVWLAGTPLGR